MTHQLDVARGRDVAARWCALAEARLEHLTELFETGRWRRYHSERAFLENIQEAKAAVETWRDLSLREASRNNNALDMSWLGRAKAALARSERRDHQVKPPQPAVVSAEPPPSIVSIVPQADGLGLSEASLEAVILGKVRLGEVHPEKVHLEEVRLEEVRHREVRHREVPAAPASEDASERTRNIAASILERYPLLRNTL
jgi:uncharacterized repeat protein (TIGR03809 family)